MPWTAEDAKRFTSAADTPKKRRQWAKVANSMLESCLKGGGEQKDCEARAIKAANAAVTKAEDSTVEKNFTSQILKRDDEKQLVYGVVLVPDEEDSQGDIAPAEVIEDAAHEYMILSRAISKMHTEPAQASVVESYIAPMDLKLGEGEVKKGSWIVALKVTDPELWGAIRKGKYAGFSVGGIAERVAV